MKALLIMIFWGISLSASGSPDSSLYNIDASWTDHGGKKQSFSKLKDERYKVVTMIFTSCPAACPLMVKHIQLLDAKLNKEQRAKVEFLLFSIDPLDETERLKAFHNKFGLDQRFRFFRSNNEDVIRDLAAVLDFKYKKIDESMYSHGTDVYLLDPNGTIIDKVDQSYKAVDLIRSIPK